MPKILGFGKSNHYHFKPSTTKADPLKQLKSLTSGNSFALFRSRLTDNLRSLKATALPQLRDNEVRLTKIADGHSTNAENARNETARLSSALKSVKDSRRNTQAKEELGSALDKIKELKTLIGSHDEYKGELEYLDGAANDLIAKFDGNERSPKDNLERAREIHDHAFELLKRKYAETGDSSVKLGQLTEQEAELQSTRISSDKNIKDLKSTENRKIRQQHLKKIGFGVQALTNRVGAWAAKSLKLHTAKSLVTQTYNQAKRDLQHARKILVHLRESGKIDSGTLTKLESRISNLELDISGDYNKVKNDKARHALDKTPEFEKLNKNNDAAKALKQEAIALANSIIRPPVR